MSHTTNPTTTSITQSHNHPVPESTTSATHSSSTNHPHLFKFLHRKSAEEREEETERDIIEHVPDISAPYAVSSVKSPVFAEVVAEEPPK
ncbi:hypothetical protein HDV00_011113 [Rhizophlyctis rosea]|nr:hypothetical protein HDV00_011113 [Rhizophlyctis rosea]